MKVQEKNFLENPVTTEIVRNALISAADEMNASLARSAFSPIIYEMKDCSVCLFDKEVRLLGQSAGLPIFLGNLDECIKITTDLIGGIEKYKEGDLYILNDSYIGGTHLNDVTTFSPIFMKGNLWDLPLQEPTGLTSDQKIRDIRWMPQVFSRRAFVSLLRKYMKISNLWNMLYG